MKKFTIFLLTFLLFVGFINVFAQKTSDQGGVTANDQGSGTRGTPNSILPLLDQALYCSGGTSALPSTVLANFAVVTLEGIVDPFVPPLTNRQIHYRTDGSAWTSVAPSGTSGNAIFWYDVPLAGSHIEVYGTFEYDFGDGNGLTKVESDIVNIYILDAPPVVIIPDLLGFMCAGGSIGLEAQVEWGSIQGNAREISYAWTNNLGATGTTGTHTAPTPFPSSFPHTFSGLGVGNHVFEFSADIKDIYNNPAPTCGVTETVDFTVIPDPTVELEEDFAEICADGSVIITASSDFTHPDGFSAEFTISIDGIPYDSDTQTGTSIADVSFTVAASALEIGANTITVDLIINNTITTTLPNAEVVTSSCDGTGNIIITVHPLPTVEFGLTEYAACLNKTLVVDAIAGGGTAPYSFEWNPDVITGSGTTLGTGSGENLGYFTVTTSPAGTGTLGVRAQDDNGCWSEEVEIDVTINPLPDVDFDICLTPGVFCDNPNSVGLPYVCAGTGAFELQGGTPEGGYYKGTGVADNMFNPASVSQGFDNIITYIYEDENGCIDSASQTLRVRQTPRGTISYGTLPFCVYNGDANSSPIVQPSLAAIVGVLANFTDHVYSIDPEEGLTLDPTNGFIDLTDAEPGDYTISWSFRNLYCPGDTFVVVTVRDLPTVSVADTVGVCFGNRLPITATATGGNLAPTAGYIYNWIDPTGIGSATGNTFTVDDDTPVGEYWIYVTATDATCTSKPDSVLVIVRPLPDVQLDLEPKIVCANIDSVELTGGTQVDQNGDPITGGTFSYGIMIQQGGTVPAEIVQHDDKFYFKPNGVVADYSIIYTYTDEYGCTSMAVARIEVAPVPVVEIYPSQFRPCVDNIFSVNASLTTPGKPDYIYTWTPVGFTGTPLSDTTSNTTSSFVVNTSTAVTGKLFVYVTDDNGCISDMDSTNVTIYPNPKIDSLTLDVLPCLGQVAHLTAHIDSTGGITLQWYFYINDATFNPHDEVYPFGSGRHTEPTIYIPGFNGPVLYSVVATSPYGCRDAAEFNLDPVLPPVTDVIIDPIPDFCNHSIINLNATITLNPLVTNPTTQIYDWVVYYYSASEGCPGPGAQYPGAVCSYNNHGQYPPCYKTVPLDGPNGTYKVDLPDDVTHVFFELTVNTVGYNCPEVGDQCAVIRPSIKTEIVGNGIDTICHGGSVEIAYSLSNISTNPANVVYYRWLENELYHEGAWQIHMLPAGATQVSFTTHPSLHTSENGPKSYCYQLEIWQGPFNDNLTLPDPHTPIDPLDPKYCHTFSDCYMVTVLKDPVVTISGPLSVVKLPDTPPVFVANVVGGHGDITYTWYLNGKLAPLADGEEYGAEYVMDDPDVLGNVGDYDIAVKVKQSYSGCEADLVVHHFTVGCPPALVNIVGPTSACIGDAITLTAVIQTEASDYTIRWKVDGQYPDGETGVTYEFIVSEPVDVKEFVVEVSLCGCEVTLSSVHYFQVLPKTVAIVDDYIICENGAVEVEVNHVNWDGQIYRYVWYQVDANDEMAELATTYVNHRLFTYSEMTGDVTTFYVKIEMLNSSCSSDMVEFTITKMGALEPVAIVPATLITCVATPVYFTLGDDPNTQLYGTPAVSWWVDGMEILGEELNYINISFFEIGTHYVYARLVYPGNDCEYLTNQVAITVRGINDVTIAGATIACGPTMLYAVVDPIEGIYSYTWFENNTPITGNDAPTLLIDNDPHAHPYVYMVKVSDLASGCIKQSQPHHIIIEEINIIGITADKTLVCEAETVMLTADVPEDNNMQYQWYADDEIIPGANAPVFYVNPMVTTVYTFTATQNGSECVAKSNYVSVKVTPTPEIDITSVTNANICEGGAVILTADKISGATYTWYKNGTIIPGATAYTIVDFPTTQSGIAAEYEYYATATVMPGCTSPESNIITITVNPALNVIVEGKDLVCENDSIRLTGFVTNYNMATGAMNYLWTLPGVTGVPVETTEYMGGFELAYEETFASLFMPPYSVEFLAAHPLPNYTPPSQVLPTGCNTGTSLPAMYNLGAADANPAGSTAGSTAGQNAADTFVALLKDAIEAQAALDGAADALIAGPFIDETAGEIKGAAYANAIVTPLFVTSTIDEISSINFNYFGYANAPPPASGSYTEACYQPPLPFLPCLTSCQILDEQTPAYRNGYVYGFRASFYASFRDTYMDEIIAQISKLYTEAYSAAFDSDYNEIREVVADGSFIPGPIGATEIAMAIKLPARDYPYRFYLTVYNENGCQSTAEPFLVNVVTSPIVEVTANHNEVCPGTPIVLTAHVIDTNAYQSEYDYKWYAEDLDNPITGAIHPELTVLKNEAGDYTYIVRAYNTNSKCETFAEYTVTVKDLTLSVTKIEDTICQGEQVTFALEIDQEDAIVTWYINGKFITEANVETYTHNFNEVGIFLVEATVTSQAFGCTSQRVEVAEITVKSAPAVTIEGPTLVCNAEIPTNLIANVDPANATVTYQWYVMHDTAVTKLGTDIMQQVSNIPSPYPYIYVVKIYDTESGCTVQSEAHYVYVEQNPVIGIYANITTVCENDEVILTANVSPDPNVIYQWYADGIAIPGANAPIWYVYPDTTTVYTFTATQIGSECVATSNSILVIVVQKPIVTDITMTPNYQQICDGGQVELEVFVDNPEAVEYYIWFDNGLPMATTGLSRILVSPLTVDGDPTVHEYNVVAVPYGKACLSDMNPTLVKTILVIRNPFIEIIGDHHVCDIYVGQTVEHKAPNVSLTAFNNGVAQWAPADYLCYQWYLDGGKYDLEDIYDAQQFTVFLAARSEPYLVRVEYDSPWGCYFMTPNFEIYVHAQPDVNITSTENEICQGGIVTLRANLADYNETDYVYQWYINEVKEENKILGATEPYYTTPAQYAVGTTTYWVIVKQNTTWDDHNYTEKCIVYESFDLIVHPKPLIDEITISKNYICTGGAVTVTAYPNANNLGLNPIYSWTRNGYPITPTGPSFTDYPPAVDNDETIYTYNATVTYENSGCTSIFNEDLAVSVTVYRNPIVVISGDANICETNKVFLKASVDHMSDIVGNLSYTWYESGEERVIDSIMGPAGQFYAEQWPPSFEPYMFTVEVTRGDGCSAMSEPFYVYVHELPVVNVTADYETVCEGGSVTLTANLNDYNTANIIVQWLVWKYDELGYPLGDSTVVYIDSSAYAVPGATQFTYVTGPLTERTKFEVRVIQTHSLCADAAEIWIDVTSIPLIVAVPVEETVCNGDQVTMTVVTTIDGEEVTDVTYIWRVNGVIIAGANVATYTPTTTNPGVYTYTVQAIVPIPGCTSEITPVGTITVKDAPSVYIQGTDIVCNAEIPTLLVAILDPSEATVTYQWFVTHNGVTTELGTESTQVVSNVPSPNPYIYVVEITDIESGCVVQAEAHLVTVEEFPVIGITADKTEVCAGETVELTAGVSGDNNMIYQWYADGEPIDDANGPTLFVYPEVTTVYTFTATQVETECVATSNIVTVTVIEAPVVEVEEVLEATICEGQQVTFAVPVIEDVTYTWYINDVIETGAELATLTYTFDHYGTFTVQVSATSNEAGCTSEIVLVGLVTVKVVPEVYIEGSTLVCDTENPTELVAIVTPSDATVTYQWFVTHNGVTEELGTESTQVVSNVPSPNPYIYVVEITDTESGCVAQAPAHTVYVEQNPEIGITADKTEVCAGETVTLTANVSGSTNMIYQWYAGEEAIEDATAPIYYAYPTETTVYTFTATQIESGCVAISNIVTVTVIPAPEITIEPVVETICQYEQVTFTATINTEEAVTYKWYIDGQVVPNAELATLTYLFDQYGEFVVEVSATSNIAGCTSEVVYVGTITVKFAPFVYIEGSTLVCDTENPTELVAIVIPSDATVTYQWFVTHNGVTEELGTETTQVVSNVPSPNPYIYVVEITDTESGCVVQARAHTVYVEQNPEIGIIADKTEVCAGETVTLTANVSESSNMIYQWYADDVAIEDATAPIHYVYPTETTVYTFTATEIGSACTATSNIVTVTVIPAPVITVIPVVETICQGDQVTFTAVINTEDAVTYTWYVAEQTITGADLSSLTYLFDQPGVFDVKVSATSQIAGCTSELVDAGTITVKAAPSVVIQGPTVVCDALDPTTLVAIVYPTNATVTYLWTEDEIPVGTASTQIVNTTPSPYPYIYTVEITDYESGCVVKSLPHTVYVEQFPVVAIIADKTEICAGETVLLTANISESPNMIYQWYADNVSIQGANAPALYVYPTVTTIYTFTAKQIGSDCIASSNIITVIVIPVPVITVDPIIATICEGDQVTFVTTLTPAIPVTYTWYVGEQTVAGADLSSLTYLFELPGVFDVKVYAKSDVAECASEIMDAGTITVKAKPTVSISGPSAVCNSTIPTYLYADITPLDAPVTYQWYVTHNGLTTTLGTQQTQQISNVPHAIPYFYKVVIVDTESGCEVVSDPHEVIVNAYSNISIGATGETEVCYGTSVTLNADVNEYVNWIYQWYYGQDPIEGEGDIVLVVNQFPGSHNYSFVATQIGTGCTANSNVVNIVVKPIPTPPVLTLSDDKICSGDPVTITGNVQGAYNWYRQSLPVATGALPSYTDQPTANNILTTYYYAATVTVNGCTSELSEVVSVIVHPTISVTLAGAHEVCEQALEGEHLAIHALVTGLQSGVSYQYEWFYRQGNNPAVSFFTGINNPYAVVPNNLSVNDPAAPYCFTVEVTAIDYGCTAISDCHDVDILTKPVVYISVNNESICQNGTITATAHVSPGQVQDYTYFWSVNGTPLPYIDQNVIDITGYWIIGVNDISVTIQRDYSSLSCFGSASKYVNVLTAPTLALTQNIAGFDLPGMCIGGQVNLFAEVVNFDETLVDPSQFIYEWRRNGQPMSVQYNFTSEVLNVAGTYNYEVRAYINNSFGCNAEWTAFDPVKVLAHPTVSIYPKDYTLSDVCVGAIIEINNELGITDATIQGGYQYKWNDSSEWINFTNQIDPRTVEFNTPGKRTFFLDVTFANPTCNATTSEPLVITVVNDPIWSVINIKPSLYEGLCLGDIVTVHAAFVGGVSDGTNHGRIQWSYKFNDEEYVNLTGWGGDKTHMPAQGGDYYYRAAYLPAHELSGCNIDPEILGPMVVEESITPAAWWVANTPGQEVVPQICANDPIGTPVELLIEFKGTPPFYFTVTGQPGDFRKNLMSGDYIFSLIVSPTVTTTYTIESLNEGTRCVTGNFIKTDVTVIVTDIEILNPTVEACSNTVDLNVKMLSYPIPMNQEVVVTFPCAAPMYLPIVLTGNYHTITIPIPDCAGLGIHVITVTIDGCDYEVTVINNYTAQGVNQLIHRRWEGNSEVLIVSNNYSNPESPYFNGGYIFTSYQWYKNGIAIPEATKQYYQDPNGVNGIYSVRLTGTKASDGTSFEFSTCDQAFNPSLSMKVYPVPAQVDETVWVEVDLTPEELEGATLEVYDAKGALVKQIPVVSRITEVSGFKAQGAYYGKITTGTNEIKSVRFLIVK